MTGLSYTATTETVHGLLRLEGPDVTVQWRVARKTEEMKGDGYHTDEELEQVREGTIPISALAGEEGLVLAHPAPDAEQALLEEPPEPG
ncbi:MAG: hypothetical protein VX815_14365 [Gemmatimonadota bacterium]|nr:hypothetical protein [Gemmatimonadota bacterium]